MKPMKPSILHKSMKQHTAIWAFDKKMEDGVSEINFLIPELRKIYEDVKRLEKIVPSKKHELSQSDEVEIQKLINSEGSVATISIDFLLFLIAIHDEYEKHDEPDYWQEG
ncbi:hypothetical protein [Paenibacillus taichungensis]|uniref:hypothetical protein n=1 Tax=Paenibacillus taichungensis TaxID=484184 RepID=UPI0039A66A78